jgi:hypothetical protein
VGRYWQWLKTATGELYKSKTAFIGAIMPAGASSSSVFWPSCLGR